MDQPGTVANPARDQLNRENEYFYVPVPCTHYNIILDGINIRYWYV